VNNQILFEYEDHWPTGLGAVSVADGTVTFRGHDLLNALEDLSWMDLLFYGVTGRRFSAAQLELFQGLWKISSSYPEPRIWNNRVAALGGSARTSAGLALGAAIATSDATLYAQRPNIQVIDFLTKAKMHCDTGKPLSDFMTHELKTVRRIPGFGRPLRSIDERLAPTERLASRLGLWGGPHTMLAFEVAKLLRPYRMGMNIAALAAGLCADQGLKPNEYYRLTLLAFSAGLIHCEYDATLHPEGTLFPLRCDRLSYRGPERRAW